MLTLFGLTARAAARAQGAVAAGDRRARRGAPLRRRRAGCSRSALIEFVHSLLLAPVRMLFHTQFVLAALTGWRLDWKSPPRDDAATGWREAAARHGAHTLLAVLWIVAIVVTQRGLPVVAVADPRSACCRRCRCRSGAAGSRSAGRCAGAACC